MRKRIPNPYANQDCFFCGSENPDGLQLEFYLDEDTGDVVTEYTAALPFRGLGNILHGGIQCGLLDEIMGWAAHHTSGEMGVTLGMHVEFLKPVYLGSRILLASRVTGRKGPRIDVSADLRTVPDGVLRAKARCTYHLMDDERFRSITYGE